MEFFEVILGRRSVRQYKPKNVSNSVVEKLLDAARWAPSGGNTQPWRFVVVRDKTSRKMLKAVSPGLSGEPPVILVACIDFSVKSDEPPIIKTLDMGAAIQNLLLAAHALGLGACWVGSANWGGVKEAVAIPERSSIEPISLVSVGYPAEKPSPRDRRPIKEITFCETFGNRWNSCDKERKPK